MKHFAFKIVFFFAIVMSSGFLYAQDAATYYKEGVALKEQKKSREAMEKFKKHWLFRLIIPRLCMRLAGVRMT